MSRTERRGKIVVSVTGRTDASDASDRDFGDGSQETGKAARTAASIEPLLSAGAGPLKQRPAHETDGKCA